MLHAWPRPRGLALWDISVPLSRTRIPGFCCARQTLQRPCRSGSCRRLCAVKVKLTNVLASRGNLLVSRALDPSQISGEGVAQASNRLVVARGGVGEFFLRGPRVGKPT